MSGYSIPYRSPEIAKLADRLYPAATLGKFREARLYQVAPISTNLILSYVGEHILGMPRSF